MKSIINKIANKIGIKEQPSISHEEKGIQELGHRNYVGGMWDEIGKLQYDFLLSNGLKPGDVFLDIACGSLRAGRHLIPYLNAGNYLGMDKEKSLIDLGLKHEMNEQVTKSKSPEFVISKDFEFQKFTKQANFAIAQSLFTHLPPNLINLCFQKLKGNFQKNGIFYATYQFSKDKIVNPLEPNDLGMFKYTPEEVIQFGKSNGWNVEIIGDWNHPRNQQIVKYTLMK